MKVRFIGKGTQYHPTLGKLVEGEVYDFPKGSFSPALFEAAGKDKPAGPEGGGPRGGKEAAGKGDAS